MSPFPWPQGEQAAVTLRFDDGLDSHRDDVAPLLERFGLRATFYLCPAGTQDEWLARARTWQSVLDAGHEIGNHSLSHPLPVALAGEMSATSYEAMTLDDYRADALEAQRRLELAFGAGEWTYCYPCYQTWVGVGRERCSVVPFIAEHFLAACAGGEVSKPYNVPAHCDLHALMSVRGEFLSGDALVHKGEDARTLNRWVILTFHGVDEGHVPVGRDALVKLLTYLRDNRSSIWTAPLRDIALHVRANR
jgi:peptidoglycan/xylan/chitin deacetylase (PgdA/CDA1 family)